MMKLSPRTRFPRTLYTAYICHNCRSPRAFRIPTALRSYSTPPPPPPSGRVLLKSRRLIYLSGKDSAHYLQGAITANVSKDNLPTSGFYAAFLNAQGRVLNDVFIYPLINERQTAVFSKNDKASETFDGGAWLIEVDANEAEKLVTHIKKYQLRAKFRVRLLDEGEAGVWSLWKGEAGKDALESADQSKDAIQQTDDETIGCLDSRAPGMGRRLIVPGNQNWEVALGEDAGLAETTEDSYRIRRYLNGIAEGQKEILPDKALVQESNLDWMGAVDYRKGCYVGQELTIRTYHTGVVRKRILPLMLFENGDIVPEKLEYKDGRALQIPECSYIGKFNSSQRQTGRWLTGIGNIGLGLVRLTMADPARFLVDVHRRGDQHDYMIEWGDETNKDMYEVKAFIPSWLLNSNPAPK